MKNDLRVSNILIVLIHNMSENMKAISLSWCSVTNAIEKYYPNYFRAFLFRAPYTKNNKAYVTKGT